MYDIPREPQSIAKVLDSSFKLFTGSFSKVLLITIIFVAVLSAPNFFIPGLSSRNPLEIYAALQSYAGLFMMVWLVFIIGYGAIFYRIGCFAKGVDSSVSSALVVGLKKLLPIILGTICFFISVAAGTLLLIIPGIILSLTLFFYMPLIILDDEGIVSSLKRSHELVWGNWWRTATVFLVPFVIYLVFSMLIGFLLGFIFAVSGRAVGTEAGSTEALSQLHFWLNTITSIVSIFAYPFFASVMIVQMNDLKLRIQGSDLESRIAAD